MERQPLVGQGLLIIEALRSHSDTPYSVGHIWTSDQLDAETFTCTTHAPGGIRTRNPSKRVAADPRLRPRGHWPMFNYKAPSLFLLYRRLALQIYYCNHRCFRLFVSRYRQILSPLTLSDIISNIRTVAMFIIFGLQTIFHTKCVDVLFSYLRNKFPILAAICLLIIVIREEAEEQSLSFLWEP
jgi:hypothetical protein